MEVQVGDSDAGHCFIGLSIIRDDAADFMVFASQRILYSDPDAVIVQSLALSRTKSMSGRSAGYAAFDTTWLVVNEEHCSSLTGSLH